MHGIGMDRVTRSWGVLGGIFLIFVGVTWLVVGLSAGIVFYYAPVLILAGFVSIVSGIASMRRRRRLAERRARREARG
jgi:hypothetical protein